MKRWLWLKVSMLLMLMAGCSNVDVTQYQDRKPALNLFEYFTGQTLAWGIFEDRFGNLQRSFTVDIIGEVDGDTLTLTEDFVYDDGELDQRIWRITDIGDGRYEGRAADVVGVAEGLVAGNTLHWRYKMLLPISGNTWQVTFDDWMYLQPDNVLINRAKVTKWGFELGTVTLFFRPKEKASLTLVENTPLNLSREAI